MTRTGRHTVQATTIPQGSAIAQLQPGCDFADAYACHDPAPQRSALQTWLDTVARTPLWMRALMAARNRIVRHLGLQDLGQLHDVHVRHAQPGQASSYRVGDRVGIFEIRHLSDTQVVLGQDDKHLNVHVALHKLATAGQSRVVVSTVVHIHNRLGHAYMAVVAPFHRRIVRATLAQLANTQPADEPLPAPGTGNGPRTP